MRCPHCRKGMNRDKILRCLAIGVFVAILLFGVFVVLIFELIQEMHGV